MMEPKPERTTPVPWTRFSNPEDFAPVNRHERRRKNKEERQFMKKMNRIVSEPPVTGIPRVEALRKEDV